MAEPILMIALSPTMEKGVIAGWQKEKGDAIETGEVICEVETDKATMDYESTQEGTLLEILLDQGESAAVGEPIAIIGDEGEDVSELKKELEEQIDGSKEPAPPKEPSSPKEAAPQTDARADREKQPETKSQPETESQAAKEAEERDSSDGRVKSSPLARSLAEQAGIDITTLSGSGPGGRIVKRDIEEAKKGGAFSSGRFSSGTAGTQGGSTGLSPGASSVGIQKERKEKISGKREVIARRLSESMREAPHFYLDIDVAIERLGALREEINRSREKEGKEKLGLNAFLIKLTAEALRRHPEILASWEGKSIHYLPSADIGLAVAQEDGLITPLVRSCESKGIALIDQELKDLVPRARKGKLKPEEYEGATFSITNLGSFGISRFTAVINPPASAILAIGALREVPVPDPQEGFRFEKQFTLTLACDHRVIDGAVGAAFLADLKLIIEEPGRALL